MIDNIISYDNEMIFNRIKEKSNLNKLNFSNILLTGGTGLFGKSILNFLMYIRQYYSFDITILTRNKYSFLFDNPDYNTDFIHFINGDIRNFNSDKEYDYIIHAAAPASEKLERENPLEMYSIILDGTKNIINIAKKMKIKKLLF